MSGGITPILEALMNATMVQELRDAWKLTCPRCGSREVIATLVFPTQDRSVYIVGACIPCNTPMKDKSVVLKFVSVSHDEWSALMSVPHLPVAK